MDFKFAARPGKLWNFNRKICSGHGKVMKFQIFISSFKTLYGHHALRPKGFVFTWSLVGRTGRVRRGVDLSERERLFPTEICVSPKLRYYVMLESNSVIFN